MQTQQQASQAVDQSHHFKPMEQAIAKSDAVPQQEGEDFGSNPIPMTVAQLCALLEDIATLDTNRVILEPGVMLAETGVVLNLDTIRAKVQSPVYTLPEMLHDLNAICEPFLNHSPEHAQYATTFLERANEAIVSAVRDAQQLPGQAQGGAAVDGAVGGYAPGQEVQQYGQMGTTGMYGQYDGQMGNGHMQGGQVHDGMVGNGHLAGYEGHQQGGMLPQPGQYPQDPHGYQGNMVLQQQPDSYSPAMLANGQFPMHTPPPYGDASLMGAHAHPHGPGLLYDSSGGSGGNRKRPRMDGRSPGSGGAVGPGVPRTRLEGRRCAVCAVIKKAGCGTEHAHFRCLKRKLPEGAAELERRVGELTDVGQEERVTVWNPKEGRKLSGQAAPMLKNLVGWLASHPGWEAHPRGSTPGPRAISSPPGDVLAGPNTT